MSDGMTDGMKMSERTSYEENCRAHIEKCEAWEAAARRVNEVNDANGWDRPDMKNLPIKLMMVVTELNEAVEATQDHANDPLNEELADVGVRLLHILESIWSGDWNLREPIKYVETSLIFQPIETVLWDILRLLCQGVEFWRSQKPIDVKIALEMALQEIRYIAESLQFDLLADIKTKTERNAKRGKWHGRARSEG